MKKQIAIITTLLALGSTTSFAQPATVTSTINPTPPTEAVTVVPGISLGSPSGFGASWGQAFIGGGAASLSHHSDHVTSAAVAGIGLGDPYRYVGLEVDGGVGQGGNFALKLHRTLPWLTSIAVGVDNAPHWGDPQQPASYYGSVTKAFVLRPANIYNPMPFFVTIGAGTGRFRSPGDQAADRHTVGAFSALALQFVPRMSAIADYNGEQLNAGLGVVPFAALPVTAVVGLQDLAQRRSGRTPFFVAASYVFQF